MRGRSGHRYRYLRGHPKIHRWSFVRLGARVSSENGKDGIVLHSNGEDFAVESSGTSWSKVPAGTVLPDGGVVQDDDAPETSQGKLVPEIDPATMQPTGREKRFRLATGAPVAASLRQPTIQRRKAATLSSVERSALMDELVDQLIEVKRKAIGVHASLAEHRAMLDAHAGVVNRRTFWARLRWLWSGV